jgi:hypothetical protein
MPTLPEDRSEADAFIQRQEQFRAQSEELLAKAHRLADVIQERITQAMACDEGRVMPTS